MMTSEINREGERRKVECRGVIYEKYVHEILSSRDLRGTGCRVTGAKKTPLLFELLRSPGNGSISTT